MPRTLICKDDVDLPGILRDKVGHYIKKSGNAIVEDEIKSLHQDLFSNENIVNLELPYACRDTYVGRIVRIYQKLIIMMHTKSGVNNPDISILLFLQIMKMIKIGHYKCLEVDVTVVDANVCQGHYTNEGYPITLSVMFCAGNLNRGEDSCQGDSGGPIVRKKRSGEHIQVGVVSWGIGWAHPNLPDVYAKVGAVRNWIIDVACNQFGSSSSICNGACNDRSSGGESGGDDNNDNMPVVIGGNPIGVGFYLRTDSSDN